MSHPCVETTTATLHQLRQSAFSVTAEETGQISPDISFSWDSTQAQAMVTVHSVPGTLLTAEITLQGTPRWLALNIGLGAGAFAAGDRIGLVIDASSSVAFDCRPFVRSNRGEDRFDTLFAEDIRITASGGASVVLHSLVASDPMVWNGQFHTLILPLPKHAFRLELRDLRLVHLAAADVPGEGERTLTSVAV